MHTGLVMGRVKELDVSPGDPLLDKAVVKVSGRGWGVDFTIDDELPFSQVEDGLRHYLRDSQGWFTGSAVTLNVGRRALSFEALVRLKRLFEDEFQIKIAKVWCPHENLELILSGDVEVPVSPTPQQLGLVNTTEGHQGPMAPLVLKATCRSGTNIDHDGDVVVLGDVNPGAHITASGDIIVWGALRGIAHAGASGADADKAVIIASSLKPLQLRIDRHICIAPAGKAKRARTVQPEIAYVSEGTIVVAPFTDKFHRMEREDSQ